MGQIKGDKVYNAKHEHDKGVGRVGNFEGGSVIGVVFYTQTQQQHS